MNVVKLDLLTPEHAYLMGLLQTDGCHSGDLQGKGKVTIEINASDAQVLKDLQPFIPCFSSITERSRETNFTNGKIRNSTVLGVFNQGFRQCIAELGMMPGPKSRTICPPLVPYSEPDYVRGLIDGDGSLGITSMGKAYVSFVTASDEMRIYYLRMLERVVGVKKNVQLNKRDGVANITVTNQHAQTLAKWCYGQGDISMARKQEAAHSICAWRAEPIGPACSRYRRKWTPEEDAVVFEGTVVEAAARLGRSAESVYLHRRVLTKTNGDTVNRT